jgi:hypothetical protein
MIVRRRACRMPLLVMFAMFGFTPPQEKAWCESELNHTYEIVNISFYFLAIFIINPLMVNY